MERMTDMKFSIKMSSMEFYGYTGCLPEEKENGQIFIIDCEMMFDELPGAVNDRLEDTVDYSKVYEVIKDITENNCFDLIEHLAYEIAGKVLETDGLIREVRIRVSKPDAPIDGVFGAMEAEITRSRED